MKDFPFSLNKNGILKVYNQFPRCYPNGISEMTEQLEDIKKMGFNAVWINPIQAIGKKLVRREMDKQVKGSLYAMSDENKFNPAFKVTEDNIKQYTQAARDNELIPLFDLVLNQVAEDEGTPLRKKYNQYLKPKINKNTNKREWDDVYLFNYEDESTRSTVIEQLWKPYIFKYIDTYGFMGARIDAIRHLNKDLQKKIYDYLNECCKKKHDKKAVIMGELLHKKPLNYTRKLKSLGLTHITNSVYHADFSLETRRTGEWNDDYYLHEMGTLKKEVIFTAREDEVGLGGTVGYVGNHDILSLKEAVNLINLEGCNKENRDELFKMKEMLCGVAFTSDGGWYLLAGDEFGESFKKDKMPIVFDWFKISAPFHKKSDYQYDLRKFVGGINIVLDKMPATAVGDWVELKVVDEKGDLFIAIRHSGKGDNNLICAQLPDSELNIESAKMLIAAYLQRHSVILRNIFIFDKEVVYCFDSRLNLMDKCNTGISPVENISYNTLAK